MRLSEITSESLSEMAPIATTAPGMPKKLKVKKQGPGFTELEDEKGIITKVPNKAGEPGMIQKNKDGTATLNTGQKGPVPPVKPGDTVTVQ
jgi:hypothetical protein